MLRVIVDFRVDAEGDPVALLDCGHGRHVRHRPPLAERPWATDSEGRAGRIGTQLDCVRCDRREIPDGFQVYKSTRAFTSETIPAGLRAEHRTARGVWGRLCVESGRLLYRIRPPIEDSVLLEAGDFGVVVPEVEHSVEPQGDVQFRVEFLRAPKGSGDGA